MAELAKTPAQAALPPAGLITQPEGGWGLSAHQLTQGTQWNPFELRNQVKVSQLKIIIHQPATDELPEEKEF